MSKEEKEHKPCKTCQMAVDVVREEETDKYIRLIAEFENYKKRIEREMDKFKQFANEELWKDILPVIDSLDELYLYLHEAYDPSMYNAIKSLESILSTIDKALDKNNVIHENSVGKEFDPNYHEAIAVFETNKHPENIVVDELRRGYKLNNRLLRPATVRISKEPKEVL